MTSLLQKALKNLQNAQIQDHPLISHSLLEEIFTETPYGHITHILAKNLCLYTGYENNLTIYTDISLEILSYPRRLFELHPPVMHPRRNTPIHNLLLSSYGSYWTIHGATLHLSNGAKIE